MGTYPWTKLVHVCHSIAGTEQNQVESKLGEIWVQILSFTMKVEETLCYGSNKAQSNSLQENRVVVA